MWDSKVKRRGETMFCDRLNGKCHVRQSIKFRRTLVNQQ